MNPFLNFALYFKDPNWAPYIYELARKMQDGHVCISLDHPLTEDTLQHFSSKNIINVDTLIEAPTNIIGDYSSVTLPFILHNRHLYFQRYFKYETNILDYIQKCTNQNHITAENLTFLENNLSFLQNLFPQEQTVTNWQEVAVINKNCYSCSYRQSCQPIDGESTTNTN